MTTIASTNIPAGGTRSFPLRIQFTNDLVPGEPGHPLLLTLDCTIVSAGLRARVVRNDGVGDWHIGSYIGVPGLDTSVQFKLPYEELPAPGSLEWEAGLTFEFDAVSEVG